MKTLACVHQKSQFSSLFLDAFSRLYKRGCPSVGLSVGGQFVSWSTNHTRVKIMKNDYLQQKKDSVRIGTNALENKSELRLTCPLANQNMGGIQ